MNFVYAHKKVPHFHKMEVISQEDQTGNLSLPQEILTPYSCPCKTWGY